MRKTFIAVWILIWCIIFSAVTLYMLLNLEMLKFFFQHISIFCFVGLLIMILPILVIFLIIPREKKIIDYISTEDVPDEFEKIYIEVYDNNICNLESMRKSVRWRMIIEYILLGFSFLGYFFCKSDVILISKKVDSFFEAMTLPVFLIGIAVLYMNYKYKEEYGKTYKSEIISNFIKLVNNNLVYKGNDFEKAKIEEVYKNAGFDNSGFNRFYADDYIEGSLDNVVLAKMTDIDVKRVTGTGKNRTTVQLFKGIFAFTVGNKDIGTCIKISKNKSKVFKNENKVEMDSKEFEKYFDIYAENKILAMRILTSDIMECLTNFHNKYNINFEIVFKYSTIYLRFFTGAMFEPKVFGSSMDKELLLTYFCIFKFVVEITQKINDVLQEIEL